MTILALMVMLAGIGGSVVMVGAFAWLIMRMRRLESLGPGRDDPHQLLGRMEEIRKDLDVLQNDVELIGERMDFTERLLQSGPTDTADRLSASPKQPNESQTDEG